jgi:hypothetical protein
MIVAAAFAVLFIMTFDPWITEIIVGTAYFLSVLNVIYYYFGPKVHTPPTPPPRPAGEIILPTRRLSDLTSPPPCVSVASLAIGLLAPGGRRPQFELPNRVQEGRKIGRRQEEG